VTGFDPATGRWETYEAPSDGGGGHSLIADSKGNIYFSTVHGRSRINRIDAVTKKVTEYNPYPGADWYGLVTDKQDRLWAVGYGAMRAIAMYDPPTDQWTFYPTTYPNRRITIDPQGNVWGVQWFGNRVAKVDAVTKQVTEYVLPLKNGSVYEVWSDKDGNLWLDNRGTYNSLVKFEPKTGKFLYIPYPELNTQVPKFEFDTEGTLWDAGFGSTRQLRAFEMNDNVPNSGLYSLKYYQFDAPGCDRSSGSVRL
jgi:streptogramin lyase